MSPRPTVKKRGIGAERREAMRAEAEQAAQAERATQEDEPTPATRQAPKSTPPAKRAGASEVTRLGVYLPKSEFEAAKGAYLADWNAGGEADTFTRWIADALETHAARTTQQREALTRPTGRSATRTGTPRSFSVPSDTVARMRAAITQDQQAGRWLSDSAWAVDAIAAAVEAARERTGGQLPQPPARLPKRLRR